MHDIFVSYAHEDSNTAKQLVSQLQALGLDVWFDELELKIGDSISEELGTAINSSRFGALLLSKSYLKKQWTTAELKLFFQLQMGSGQKKILPIWHDISFVDIQERAPFLLDILSLSTNKFTIKEIAIQIYEVIEGKVFKSDILELRNEQASNEKGNKYTDPTRTRKGKSLAKVEFKKTLEKTIREPD